MQQRNWKNLPWVTIALVAANILVFLICKIDGGRLYERGRMNVSGVIGRGEYTRLLRAVFLHADFAHLLNNMTVLFFMGAMIEQAIGHVPYGVIYFLSGLGGSALSLCWKYLSRDPVGSVGASGAIFGLDGLLLAVVLFSRRDMPTVTPRRVILMIAMSLYSGFSSGNIDNAGHVGGLLAGFAAGTVYCLIRRRKRASVSHNIGGRL